ncbi:hypothetical protein KY337_01055 [Candidatus Woesearchaeota archaeon]|nr:hypothetical protein [Candidatus Woesearchaeota archaeon]
MFNSLTGRIIQCIVPLIEPDNRDIYNGIYQHRVMRQLLSSADHYLVNRLKPDKILRKKKEWLDLLFKPGELWRTLKAWVIDWDKQRAKQWYDLIERNPEPHATVEWVKGEKNDKFNNITKVYELFLTEDSKRIPLNIVGVSRPINSYGSKHDFDTAFKAHCAAYDLGALVVRPVALMRDSDRSIEMFKQELATAKSSMPLEDLVGRTRGIDRKEIYFTEKLPGLRSDKAIAYLGVLSKTLESQKRRGSKKQKALRQRQANFLTKVRSYALDKHFESVVDSVGRMSFNSSRFSDDVAVRDISEFMQDEFERAILKLERATIHANHGNSIDPCTFDKRKYFRGVFEDYFVHLARLITDNGFVGVSHGEAVLHHFAPDKDGIPRAYDFDKLRKNFFVFYDVITLANNLISNSNYRERKDYFLRSVVYFARKQLEYNGPEILRFNVDLGKAKEMLAGFEISDRSNPTKKHLKLIDQEQLKALETIFDMYSAAYYVVLAGRASELSYIPGDAYAKLQRQKVETHETHPEDVYWVDAYISEHREDVNKELFQWKKYAGSKTSEELLNELRRPLEFELGEFYDATLTRKLCASKMYESLNNLLETIPNPGYVAPNNHPHSVISRFKKEMEQFAVSRKYTSDTSGEICINQPVQFFNSKT